MYCLSTYIRCFDLWWNTSPMVSHFQLKILIWRKWTLSSWWFLQCDFSALFTIFLRGKKIIGIYHCGEPAISPCLTGPVDYPFASRHKGPGFKPWGYLCKTGILLLALSCYIGDPDVIDHCGLVWGEPHPEPLLGPRADDVIIPLDLTQLSGPGFTLAAGLPFGFTTDGVGCWGGAL
jgi:hypothetical protein